MRAAVIIAPNQLQIQDVPEPITNEYDCLCETLAVGICNGTDHSIIGNHPYHNVHFPAIIGHEGIGRVISCGSRVRHIHPGDIVTRPFNQLPPESGITMKFGALAEKTIVTDFQAMQEDGIDRSEWQKYTVHRVLPRRYDPIAATMLITWRETYAFLMRMQPESRDRILIIGSGANALSFANHAKNIGIQTMTIGSENRRTNFEKMGSIFFSYKTTDVNYTIMKNTNTHIDIIIDTIGNSKNLNPALPLLKQKGKIGIYGLEDFSNYQIAATKTQGDFQVFSGEHYNEGSAHDAVMTFVNSGKLNAWDYISKEHVYPLSKIHDALTASKERKTFKSVVTFNDVC